MTTTASGRQGDWILTFTGRAFWPLDARPDEIDSRDIAHALSMLCRFGGHTRRFYSVAEHCVLMSYAVAPEYALAALLHDAAEAYMVDLPRPIKRNLPTYGIYEDSLLDCIARKYGLHHGPAGGSGRDPEYVIPKPVKEADNRILLDERAALLTSNIPWASLIGLQPLGINIRAWTPQRAESEYANRLSELLNASGGALAE